MNIERAPRKAPVLPRLFGIALGALALATAGLLSVSHSNDTASAQCPAEFTLDFGGLPAGTILSGQYADSGVHISAVANGDHPDALITFDTNAPPTHDPDLAVDIGNIAILAENVQDKNNDGLVDDPDENNFGGRVTFTFDQDVTIGSFVFVDHDHQPSDHAAAYDASGNLIKQVTIPIAGNGSVQTVDVNAAGVRRFELVYRDSAGFTGIEVGCEQPGAGATPTTAAGGQATPTATPVEAGAATPSPAPLGAAATPTPAVSAQATTSPAAQQAAAAVAGAVQPPAAQQGAAPLPAAIPAGGGRPSDGGTLAVWIAVALMGLGGALIAGGVMEYARELKRY